MQLPQLIATDLDGTLLNSQKELSPKFIPLCQELLSSGVKIVIASGRQYHNIKRLFYPILEQVYIIAENGGLIYHNNTCLYADEINASCHQQLLSCLHAISGTRIVFCGIQSAYTDCQDPDFFQIAHQFFYHLEVVPDLLQVSTKDTICKIAIFNEHQAEAKILPQLQLFKEHYAIALSGDSWIDLMNPATNKGQSLVFIQEKEKLLPKDCLAFGDYLNDFELLQVCNQRYAMQNAHPKLKAIATAIAPSNDADGVVTTLNSLFLK